VVNARKRREPRASAGHKHLPHAYVPGVPGVGRDFGRSTGADAGEPDGRAAGAEPGPLVSAVRSAAGWAATPRGVGGNATPI
jgi:hypothetical protein